MARVFGYLHGTDDILTADGVELPLEGRSTTTPQTRLDRGKAVQGQIVGPGRVEQMHADAPADTAHFQRYPSGNLKVGNTRATLLAVLTVLAAINGITTS